MISRYKTVAIIYGGERGKQYAKKLNEEIFRISETERYPIRSKLIMENILTREILSEVMNLFRQSEFCVAFLTEDEFSSFGKKTRLRQNVVFELGMALIQLGRERCILLSDFDYKSIYFDAPSDMSSLDIRIFHPVDVNVVINDIIIKILQDSRKSIISGSKSERIPQYNNLLTRTEYFIDYENLFATKVYKVHREHNNYFRTIIQEWMYEYSELMRYDEKSIFLLERLCFLPIFGWSVDLNTFLSKMENEILTYNHWDISYYQNTEILDFVKNIVQEVIVYTGIKEKSETSCQLYKTLLDGFLLEKVPKDIEINPLVLLVYYNYMGLIYLKLLNYDNKSLNGNYAKEAFKNALKYVGKVDMSIKIWSGFIYYNLARAYMFCGDLQEADFYYKKAIRIRSQWPTLSVLNIKLRNALSFEYFLAKISQLEMYENYMIMSQDEIQKEFEKLETEVDTYVDAENPIDPLIEIKKRLMIRKIHNEL